MVEAFDDGLGVFEIRNEVFKIRAAQPNVVFKVEGIFVENGVLESDVEKVTGHLRIVLEVNLLFLALLVAASHEHAVKRRLSNVDVTAFDQLRHLTVEERKKQRTDVRAVYVGIGHENDAVVAQFIDVEVVL